MTLLIPPLSWKFDGLANGIEPSSSDTRIVIVNGRMEKLTEIQPGQVLGRIPTREDCIEIATALVNSFNTCNKI